MAELSPYEFCTVIQDIHPASGGIREIQCVQALDRNIYLGCSDGTLMRYVLEELADGTVGYQLAFEYTMQSKRPIESIQLATTVAKAVVLCNDQIHFFGLPAFEPVHVDILRPLRNALNFVLNETPVGQEPVGIAVIKRNSVAFWELGNKLRFLKEVNTTVTAARRTGSTLCVADTENYNIMDLRTSSISPFHPISIADTYKILPQIQVSKHDEYLIVMCSGVSPDYQQIYSMGLFVNGNGDPTQAPIEWSSFPDSVCVDGERILSLHLGDSIPKVEVRIMNSTEVSQTLSLPVEKSQSHIHLLTLARSGFSAPINMRKDKLIRKPVVLFELPTAARSGAKDKNEDYGEQAGSGLTPPPTPKPLKHSRTPSRAHSRTLSIAGNQSQSISVLPTSRVLLATARGVFTLLPSSLLSQVEGLLEDGRVKEAAGVLSQVHSRHAKDEELANDFKFLNLRIGLEYLQQTLFDDAGDALFRGDMDPRWIIALWDEWRAVAIHASEGEKEVVMMETYSGLEPYIQPFKGLTIERLISNYSPHLKPSTALSTAGQELQATLKWSARNMLEKYLRKFRTRREFVAEGEGMYSNRHINRAVDTVSALIYSKSSTPEDIAALQDLLFSPYLHFPDLRPSLLENQHIDLVAQWHEKHHEQEQLIELYKSLAENSISAPSISDPIDRIIKILETSEKSLGDKYLPWVAQKDPERGFKLIISTDSQARTVEQDTSLLSIFQPYPSIALEYLEHLVLAKQHFSSDLHTQLALSYVAAVTKELETSETLDKERAILDRYLDSQTHKTTQFLSYFAFSTPDSKIKNYRLKLCLFLQGSTLYSLSDLRKSIPPQSSPLGRLLALERAILHARANEHKPALSILVNELRDYQSAEAYVSLGGSVVTPKLAREIGDGLELQAFASLLLSSEMGGASCFVGIGRLHRQAPTSANRSLTEREEERSDKMKIQLTRMLLEVYMYATDGQGEAGRLLDAQGVNLNAEEIIPLMPSSWPLTLVSSFLSRSFRRSLHLQYEGQILKQLSAGENLQTSEWAFEAFAAAGAMIEEAGESEGDEREKEEQSRVEGEEGKEKIETSAMDQPRRGQELGSVREKFNRTNEANLRSEESKV